jgi:arylsulfatase A-like enzyme
MTKRPNIVYVFADQLRYDSLGCTGNALAQTPNIDRFASQSASFVNAVVNTPVCTAHRASLLTGKHTTSHGMVINELRMNPNQRCLGHMLTDAGYNTAYIGKWHLYANELGGHYEPRNSFVPPGPHRLGFDGEWKAFNFHHENFSPPAYYHEETPERIGYGPGEYEPTVQTDQAIDFIRRAAHAPDGRPFSLILSYGPPHDPWGPDNVPERFWRMFSQIDFPNPPNYRDSDDAPYADRWATLSDAERSELESWRRGYHAQVASLDAEFGRLMAALQGSGQADDTIVVFTSDHGEMFGAHGRRAKLIFYEEAARVPFLMRWPGQIPPGTAPDVCLSTVDILPSLAGLADMAVADDVEGMDLSHCARGRPGPEPEAVLLQGCGATAKWVDGHEWRAVRDKRFTYAVFRLDGKEMLFDRANDPYQLSNVVEDPAYQEDRSRLRELMETKMARINDTFELSSWYRDNWTDGDRRILRSATADFGNQPR